MEKEINCSNYGLMEISSEQLSNCYFHPNWEDSIPTMDQNDPFESTLSSIVSSPTITSSNGVGDGMMIKELIGRLGSICDSGNNSTITSSYSTPLNSPPSKFNLSSLLMMGNNSGNYPIQKNLGSFDTDPGFVERAAKFSCFGSGNSNNIDNGKSGMKLESGKLSRVNSDKKLGDNGEFGDSREGSSVSEQNPGAQIGVKLQNDTHSKKRKSVSRAKKINDKVEVENEESNSKRKKVDDDDKEAKKENAEENRGESNDINKEKQKNNEATKAEAPKDYIHVRARRGQATDSHSLAERVRREKISERMKFLQDLVPGCNKVTGKATVLDEIINYVQSLQRQVEFLSMKLATVNPRMELNMESILSKDMFHSRGSPLPQAMYPIDQNSAQALPFGYQSTQPLSYPLQNGVPNGIENHFPANNMNSNGIGQNPNVRVGGFIDSMAQIQLPTLWEDDLQSIVQMGIVQNQTQNVPIGTMPNAQMKVEL